MLLNGFVDIISQVSLSRLQTVGNEGGSNEAASANGL